MARVVCATLPRSGHHFLAHCVSTCAEDRLFYCQGWDKGACCKSLPCTRSNGKPVLQKLHDLRHDAPTNLPGVQYVMQYREPVGQLLSYVELLWERDPAALPIEDAAFAERLVARLAVSAVQFLTKWGRHENVVPIRYDWLFANPADWIERILTMLEIEHDAPRVRELVRRQVKLKPATVEQGRYRPRDLTQPLLSRSLVAAYDKLVRERTPFIDWPASTYEERPREVFLSAYEAAHGRWVRKRSSGGDGSGPVRRVAGVRFGPTDHIAGLNKSHDEATRVRLWEAKYREIEVPRDPKRLFANAARLAGQIDLDPGVLDFLFANTRIAGIARPEWQRRVATGFAALTIIRDNKWRQDVCCELNDSASEHAARKALEPRSGVLVLVAHVGFLQMAFAFLDRVFEDAFYLGVRDTDPRAALFEGLRSLTAGKAVVIAPDGGRGSRQFISVLGRKATIGMGAAFLAYETHCPTVWLNANMMGERFAISVECGPRREKSEAYSEFSVRLSRFYERMINNRLTGEPDGLAMGDVWLRHLQRAAASRYPPEIRRHTDLATTAIGAGA